MLGTIVKEKFYEGREKDISHFGLSALLYMFMLWNGKYNNPQLTPTPRI